MYTYLHWIFQTFLQYVFIVFQDMCVCVKFPRVLFVSGIPRELWGVSSGTSMIAVNHGSHGTGGGVTHGLSRKKISAVVPGWKFVFQFFFVQPLFKVADLVPKTFSETIRHRWYLITHLNIGETRVWLWFRVKSTTLLLTGKFWWPGWN